MTYVKQAAKKTKSLARTPNIEGLTSTEYGKTRNDRETTTIDVTIRFKIPLEAIDFLKKFNKSSSDQTVGLGKSPEKYALEKERTPVNCF